MSSRERERDACDVIDITLKSRVIMHVITSTARWPYAYAYASTRSEPAAAVECSKCMTSQTTNSNSCDRAVAQVRPRLHVSGSSGYPAPDRPFVYTYPGQMYAIRSIMVRYPERFENDFKGGQPGCLDPFSSSVNGVPGYPDRFWIQFSMAKKNSGRVFTCRAGSLSGAFRLIFAFDFLYFRSLPQSRQK